MIINITQKSVKDGLVIIREGDTIHEIKESSKTYGFERHIGKEIKTIRDTFVYGLIFDDLDYSGAGLNLDHIISIKRNNPNGRPIKINWKPQGFMMSYYPTEKNDSFSNKAYNIIFGKYGNTPMWNNTIFYLGDIVVIYRIQYGNLNSKHPKFKQRVLRIASKCRYSLKALQAEYEREERDFYEDDMEF